VAERKMRKEKWKYFALLTCRFCIHKGKRYVRINEARRQKEGADRSTPFECTAQRKHQNLRVCVYLQFIIGHVILRISPSWTPKSFLPWIQQNKHLVPHTHVCLQTNIIKIMRVSKILKTCCQKHASAQ